MPQLRRLYCRLVVQWRLRSGDRIGRINGSAKPFRLMMKSARIMPQIRIATISVLLITTANQRAFIRTSGSAKSIFVRIGNGLDATWCGARDHLSQIAPTGRWYLPCANTLLPAMSFVGRFLSECAAVPACATAPLQLRSLGRACARGGETRTAEPEHPDNLTIAVFNRGVTS